jgi:hypothetical protein
MAGKAPAAFDVAPPVRARGQASAMRSLIRPTESQAQRVNEHGPRLLATRSPDAATLAR